MSDVSTLIDYVDNKLLPNIDIKSVRHFDPIVVKNVPEPWVLLGVGNYATGLTHPAIPEFYLNVIRRVYRLFKKKRK